MKTFLEILGAICYVLGTAGMFPIIKLLEALK